MLDEMPTEKSKGKPTPLKKALIILFFITVTAAFLFFVYHTLIIVRD